MPEFAAAVHGAPPLPLVAAVTATGFVILRHRREIVAWTTRALGSSLTGRLFVLIGAGWLVAGAFGVMLWLSENL